MKENNGKQKTVVVHLKNLRYGFSQVPNAVQRNSNLSMGARLTYGVLLSYGWQDDFCFPAQETLGKDLGVSSRHVRRFLNELKESGYITWKQQGLNRPNIYHILDVDIDKIYEKQQDNLDRTPVSTPDRTSGSGQERTYSSDKEYSVNNIHNNVNVDLKNPLETNPEEESKTVHLIDEILAVTGPKDKKSVPNYKKELPKFIKKGVEQGIFVALSNTKDAINRNQIRTTPGAYFYDQLKREGKERGIVLNSNE